MKRFRVAALTAALMVGSAASAQTGEAAPAAVDYAQERNWLCLPGRADACGMPLPTTALNANGYGSTGLSTVAKDPPIDCFYVYPTVSRDPAHNSDLDPGPEEQAVAAVQFARFASVCRTFAPLYRQATLAALFAGGDPTPNMDLAYADVLAAWRDYLANRNQGRPFVLIGHSQGTIHLSRLLAQEIENSPAAERMLSALLIGFNVEVPEGKKVGGTFQSTPLCARVGETGCIVTYVSFRSGSTPPEGGLFGRAIRPGMTVGCTNPARLAQGSAPLDSYWFAAAPPTPGGPPPVEWSSQGEPPTPFLRTEGLASAACVHKGPVGYLSVATNADPADARTDRIPGDVYIAGAVQPAWGMHLADMNLAQGDLIALVEAQAEAFGRR